MASNAESQLRLAGKMATSANIASVYCNLQGLNFAGSEFLQVLNICRRLNIHMV